ncbi:hypothetical protein LAUMK35_05487 [Mycobacterium pseudokansasii]|uniref:Glycerophosphoryl diester phosphodiesterase membrane domain-containing protein n=1 Tax=Mycobacterium pseudokansasii TaxID=2341080 RepID=A0A498QW41_9MYCO|nr:hypothetical protein LAUMK35_05487 [Mycobacterium pseudokansasii]VBA35063.1 hypothetical protein LAUMK21_05447 [Mycobacterium pseudokansasii]VBA56214.1 hypothetical protein LAUMK142_05443 [Mycobacterium pseudokansasii]
MSTLPPSYPVDPPAETPGYIPAGYPPLGAGYPPPPSQTSGYGAPPPGYGVPPGYGAPPGYGMPPGYGPPPPGYGAPPPGYGAPPPGYGAPPPGYGAPPPGYGAPPPGYGAPPPGYGAPPGYGPPPPGYGPPLVPGAVKPGIIPLRPLTLSDIYNGAVGYIRTNPKATLGLTAIVVVIMQVITLIATVGPLTALNQLKSQPSTELSLGVLGAWMGSVAASGLVTWLGGMLLSGILTVVVGRAVFGSPITIGEAWARVRGRVPALIGLALLEAAGMVALAGLVVVILVGVAAAVNGAAAVLVGIPLLLLVGLLLAYLYTMLVFAPVLIVLERLPLVDAVTRSFRLVRGGFWRVLGIRLLTALVVGLVGGAVAAPFSIASQILLGVTASEGSIGMLLVGTTLSAVGSAISQIITAPFTAGVVVLLYTDRRMRAEAFDLVLQTGAAGGPAAVESTDNLWLTRPY